MESTCTNYSDKSPSSPVTPLTAVTVNLSAMHYNWFTTGFVLVLVTRSFVTITVQCAKDGDIPMPKKARSQPSEDNGQGNAAGRSGKSRHSERESQFQSVAIEMILFPGPGHVGENCQQICDRWFVELEAFISKAQAGFSMLRYPMIFKDDGTDLRWCSNGGKVTESNTGFKIDPCLYYRRYCIVNSDIWLTAFEPDQLADGIDRDLDEALRATGDLASQTLRGSWPVTRDSLSNSQTLSILNYWLGHCCMCRKFLVFAIVRKENPVTQAANCGKAYKYAGTNPPESVRCHPNDICTRITSFLFVSNRRSNQWFCHSAFVVKGSGGQGIKWTDDKAGHCPCELEDPRGQFSHETQCFSPQDILKGMVDAKVRSISAQQQALQITSLRTIMDTSDDVRTSQAGLNSLIVSESIENEFPFLDELLLMADLPEIAEFPAQLRPNDQQQHGSFDLQNTPRLAEPRPLDELAFAGAVSTHTQIGQLDSLASQQYYQNLRQSQQQLISSTSLINPELTIGGDIRTEDQFSFHSNIDSLLSAQPRTQQVNQDSGSANEASTSGTASIIRSTGRNNRKRKRKASELEPMDRTRVSDSRSAFIDLDAANDALPRHNRDEGTLESVFRLDQGTSFNVEDPEPVQHPLAQIVSETTDASADVDSTTKPDKDLLDLFPPFL